MTRTVVLSGEDLTAEDVWAVALEGGTAALAPAAQERMRAAREVVTRAAHGEGEHTYGINTGFGKFVSEEIPPELAGELQLRLLRSHACGVGDPYPDEIVRAAMLLRANTLAKGYSGARVELVELLVECIDRGLVPRVPRRGSVGASGDLARSRTLRSRSWATGRHGWTDELLRGQEALRAPGLAPIELRAKEGLSLVNGTQLMAAFGPLGLVRAQRLAKVADLACAMAVEALQGSRHELLPSGARAAAFAGSRRLRRTSCACSRLRDHRAAHRWCDKVQDPYSLRCAPQVHGAARDLLD